MHRKVLPSLAEAEVDTEALAQQQRQELVRELERPTKRSASVRGSLAVRFAQLLADAAHSAAMYAQASPVLGSVSDLVENSVLEPTADTDHSMIVELA